jgi:hypothetical protein
MMQPEVKAGPQQPFNEPQDLDLPPAPASPDWVLAREPNRLEDAISGPDPQISATTYVEWTKHDGDTFLAPLSQSEVFERKGYRRGQDKTISNLVTYLAGREDIVEETKQPPEDALRRIAGEPRSEEEAEQDRERIERDREAKFEAERQVIEERQRLADEAQQRTQAGPSAVQQPQEHPLGGPPGQTGEHPQGGPPGQTGEHPVPPPTAEQLPTEPPDETPSA